MTAMLIMWLATCPAVYLAWDDTGRSWPEVERTYNVPGAPLLPMGRTRKAHAMVEAVCAKAGATHVYCRLFDSGETSCSATTPFGSAVKAALQPFNVLGFRCFPGKCLWSVRE